MDETTFLQLVKESPRPHYVTGLERFEETETGCSLVAKVYFRSEGDPAIEDRGKLYLPNPHVNIGSFCFATWNAAHAAAANYTGSRTLRKQLTIEMKNMIPPDTDLLLSLDLEVYSQVMHHEILTDLGRLNATLHRNDLVLATISGHYAAQSYSR